MTLTEWLRRLLKLEREQREHFREGRTDQGEALGKLICQWISEGRVMGFCVPDGRPVRQDGELAR